MEVAMESGLARVSLEDFAREVVARSTWIPPSAEPDVYLSERDTDPLPATSTVPSGPA